MGCHRDDGGRFIGGWGERQTGELWGLGLRPVGRTVNCGQLGLRSPTTPTSAEQRARVKGERGGDLDHSPRAQCPFLSVQKATGLPLSLPLRPPTPIHWFSRVGHQFERYQREKCTRSQAGCGC